MTLSLSLSLSEYLSLSLSVKECAASSPTSYFWFRKALDISDSIDQSGEFNPVITGCLLAAWTIVCLAMIKGIKSSAKVQTVNTATKAHTRKQTHASVFAVVTCKLSHLCPWDISCQYF